MYWSGFKSTQYGNILYLYPIDFIVTLPDDLKETQNIHLTLTGPYKTGKHIHLKVISKKDYTFTAIDLETNIKIDFEYIESSDTLRGSFKSEAPKDKGYFTMNAKCV